MFSYQEEFAFIDSPQNQTERPLTMTEDLSQELISRLPVAPLIDDYGVEISK